MKITHLTIFLIVFIACDNIETERQDEKPSLFKVLAEASSYEIDTFAAKTDEDYAIVNDKLRQLSAISEFQPFLFNNNTMEMHNQSLNLFKDWKAEGFKIVDVEQWGKRIRYFNFKLTGNRFSYLVKDEFGHIKDATIEFDETGNVVYFECFGTNPPSINHSDHSTDYKLGGERIRYSYKFVRNSALMYDTLYYNNQIEPFIINPRQEKLFNYQSIESGFDPKVAAWERIRRESKYRDESVAVSLEVRRAKGGKIIVFQNVGQSYPDNAIRGYQGEKQDGKKNEQLTFKNKAVMVIDKSGTTYISDGVFIAKLTLLGENMTLDVYRFEPEENFAEHRTQLKFKVNPITLYILTAEEIRVQADSGTTTEFVRVKKETLDGKLVRRISYQEYDTKNGKKLSSPVIIKDEYFYY
ncbi:MAG TPA: hypothetical protein DIW47_12895 [Bacteroidetes bacterium]|nr:hypothetical protein [Bacteroidota bacterium]